MKVEDVPLQIGRRATSNRKACHFKLEDVLRVRGLGVRVRRGSKVGLPHKQVMGS